MTGGEDGTARLWDAADGRLLVTVAAHDKPLWKAALDPGGRRLLTTSEDGSARLFDAASGELLHELRHDGPVPSGAWSPDGALVATADRAGVHLWDPATGASRGRLEGHSLAAYGLAFDPSGATLASAADDQKVILWDVAHRGARRTIPFETEVYAVGFDPAGATLVTGGQDNRGRLWNAADGALLATLDGHTDLVVSASFSSDGRRILTASLDGSARVWHPSGKLLYVIDGHGSPLYGAAFSPDGARVVTGGGDGIARIWDLPLETRPPEDVARLIACRVPWKLKDGRPLPAATDPRACIVRP